MRRFPIYSNTSLIYALVLSFSAAVWAQSDKKPQTTISEERASESGMVEIDVSDIVGRPLHTVVEFVDSRGSLVRSVEFPSGIGETSLPRGRYEAHVSVAHMGALFLVEVKPIQVSGQEAAYLLVSLAEGSANLGLHEFDRDTDLVIDRVELAVGTDPDDPKSLPGHETLEWPSPVLSSDAGWYVGDLHTFTDASIGSESVSKLVSRAERSKLDFLAITDRNTLAHTRDRGYRSNSVVLIPAMEWGTDDSGYALILKPGTVPRPANGDLHAQTVLDRVVQQGGVFAPAHPCFPTSPWLRTIGYFNAVEVWCREWRMIPPLTPRALPEHLLATSESKLLYPVARAAQSSLHSAKI